MGGIEYDQCNPRPKCLLYRLKQFRNQFKSFDNCVFHLQGSPGSVGFPGLKGKQGLQVSNANTSQIHPQAEEIGPSCMAKKRVPHESTAQ